MIDSKLCRSNPFSNNLVRCLNHIMKKYAKDCLLETN